MVGELYRLPSGSEKASQVIVDTEVTTAAHHHLREQHGKVDGGKLDAAVQFDDRAATVQVTIVAVLSKESLCASESFGGFDGSLIDVVALDIAFEDRRIGVGITAGHTDLGWR